MHVMFSNLWRAKKGLTKFYFRQPLGNPTYSSPNLAILDSMSHNLPATTDLATTDFKILITGYKIEYN